MEQNRDLSMKPFFVLWSGQAISLFGSQLVQFALIWWLTETTGSATVLAMASLVGLMPQVILGPFIGVLVDRFNRRLIMLVSDSTVALATVALAALFWMNVVQVWHVFVILFVRALAGSFHFPAMMASTTLMVPKDQLTRIQGLNQTLQGALSIVSAPIGALLLSVLPMQGILGIDVVTAFIAVFTLFIISVPQPESIQAKEKTISSFWADFREGLNYIRGWKGLMMLTGMAMIIKIVLNPAFALIPIFVTDHFNGDAIQLGYLNSAAGIGIVLGGLVLGAWGGFKRRIYTSFAGFIGLGSMLVLLGVVPSSLFWLALVGTLGVGLTIPFIDGPLLAILQATIAPEKQGRVFMIFGSLVSSTAPLGLLVAGPLADLFGVQIWFLVAGALIYIVMLIGLFVPAIKNIEDYQGVPENVGLPVDALQPAVPAD